MDEIDEQPAEQSPGGEGGLQTDIADADKRRLRADMKMLETAVRQGWDISDVKRRTIVKRLMTVVRKSEVRVMTKMGPEFLDAPADANAIGAARVLVAMDAINQSDHWNNDKNQRLDSGKATDRLAIVPNVTLRGVD